MSARRVSVVIPSLHGNVDGLLADLAAQSFRDFELQVVRGVQPAARARNCGARAAQGETLIFLDDDVRLSGAEVLARLLEPLADAAVGVTGAVKKLPPDASWFQRRLAREIPRVEDDVPDAPRESNPPLDAYGHSEITTVCCALRRAVFDEVGGFDEGLVTGEDPDLFCRIRQRGYRFVIAPRVWVYHPAIGNVSTLLRKYFWYGVGSAQEAQRWRARKLGPQLRTRAHAALFAVAATAFVVPNILVPYSPSYPRWELGFRPLKALSTYAAALGYAWWWWQQK